MSKISGSGSMRAYVPPNKFANTAVWLRGDLGRTIVYPSVSSDFTTWGHTNSNVTSTGDSVPGGYAPYNLYDDSTASASHYTSINGTNTTIGVTKTLSVIAKTSGRNIRIASKTGTPYTNFDLSVGTVGTSTATSATITDLGGGWYLCSQTFTSAGIAFIIYLLNGTNPTYSGDGSSGAILANPLITQAGSVSAWANQGNNTSVLSSVSQATFSKMPLVSTIDGMPSLLFSNANSTSLGGTITGTSLANPLTLFTATNYTAGKSLTQRIVCDSVGSVGPYFTTADAFGTYTFGAIFRQAFASAISRKYVNTILYNGASSNAWSNGVNVGLNDTGTGNLSTTLRVGANATGAASFYDDHIMEIIYYIGNADADGARVPIENYLMHRYGVI